MASRPLASDVTSKGWDQQSVTDMLLNIMDVVNELQSDHAAFITLTTELKADGSAAFADLTALRAAIVGITAKLDLDGGVTDTNYAATLNPAALTATAIAAANVSTLTNATAITNLRS